MIPKLTSEETILSWLQPGERRIELLVLSAARRAVQECLTLGYPIPTALYTNYEIYKQYVQHQQKYHPGTPKGLIVQGLYLRGTLQCEPYPVSYFAVWHTEQGFHFL